MSAPNPDVAGRVDELGRIRDLAEALPDVGGYIDRAELAALLRERMDELCWGADADRQAPC